MTDPIPPVAPQNAAPEKDCKNCGNRCMDMDMEPYCAAVNKPWGQVLFRGKPKKCGDGSLLWKEDNRGRSK